MSALDKVLALHQDTGVVADPASDLVAAAAACLDDLIILLAKSDSSDDDSPPWAKKKGKGSKSGDENDDDDSEPDDDDDDDTKSKAKKKAKKKVKATAAALAAGARIALAGLASADTSRDWVEATAGSAALSLTASADVGYGDPGLLADGKLRYPLDREHIYASAASFTQLGNSGKYTEAQARTVWDRIRLAASKAGIDTMVLELAAAAGEGGVPMQHPPFSGRHNHPHSVMGVHSHAHDHNADSRHQCGVSAYGDY